MPTASVNYDANRFKMHMASERSRCQSQHPLDKNHKPLAPYMGCIAAAESEFWKLYDTAAYQISLDRRSRVVELSEQFDKGKLSKERMTIEMEKLDANIAQKFAQMHSSQMQAQANANALDQQRRLAMMKYGAALMTPPAIPQPVTCTTMMNTVTCR